MIDADMKADEMEKMRGAPVQESPEGKEPGLTEEKGVGRSGI